MQGDVQGPVISGDENISAGGHVIIAEQGATVVVGELPVKVTAVDRESVLGRYLQRDQPAALLFQAPL